mgnify:CR=1 FL=1
MFYNLLPFTLLPMRICVFISKQGEWPHVVAVGHAEIEIKTMPPGIVFRLPAVVAKMPLSDHAGA